MSALATPPAISRGRAGRLRALEGTLLDLWGARGYEEILPPLLLPEEPARAATPEALWPRTLRVPANGDGTMVLRSDFTAAAAWMVVRRGTALVEPLRICYAGPVARRPSAEGSMGCELRQAGCERVDEGPAGDADAEMVHLAASCLKSLGLPGAILELGHWGLVGPLLDRAPWPDGARPDLERALNRKSLPALDALAERWGRCAEWGLLRDLIHLGGRSEAVDALCHRLRALGIWRAWEELRGLGEGVLRDFPDLRVRLEPTDVRHWSYYTGVTVKAFAPERPAAVLSGGRYDGLFPALGRPWTAFGFAVHLDAVLGE